MQALVFFEKSRTTSIVDSSFINKHLNLNRATVRWGRVFRSVTIIAESDNIVWLESIVVNTDGIITGCSQSLPTTDDFDRCECRRSHAIQPDTINNRSVVAKIPNFSTTSPSTLAVRYLPITTAASKSNLLATAGPSHCIFARPMTSSIQSNWSEIAAVAFSTTSTTTTATASNAADATAPATIPTTTTVIVTISAPTTAKITSSTSVTTAASTPTNSTTNREDAVEIMDGSNAYVDYIDLKDVMRFNNKPKEMVRRLLMAAVGREQLVGMSFEGTESTIPIPPDTVRTIYTFITRNSGRKEKLTSTELRRCVTLFLYNLRNPKKR